jgi:hypothetical protein
MLTRNIIEEEMSKTHREIESFRDQILLKEAYLASLQGEIRKLNEIERMG